MPHRHCLAAIALVLAAASCSEEQEPRSQGAATADPPTQKAQPGTPVLGSWDARVYNAPHFGLRLTVPSEWYLKKGGIQAAMDWGIDDAAGDDTALRNGLRKAAQNKVTIFWAFRHPPGRKGNPGVVVLIENVGMHAHVATAADYLLLLEKTQQATRANVKYRDRPRETRLGGVEFATRLADAESQGLPFTQRYLARKRGPLVLFALAVFGSPDEERVTRELLDTIEPLAAP